MNIRQPISIGNLLLDVKNYRIVTQDSQKEARDAIIAEQGKKLIKLATDIIQVGLSPIDLLLVMDAENGNGDYVGLEGNRRITALQLLLKPELCEGTPVHAAFKKLNKNYADSIPKVMECVIVPNRKAGLVWINRKHQSGLEGAGTEPWSAMAKARADVDEGIARPDLDAVNFVLTNPDLDPAVRKSLEGAQFNITSLKRLVETKDVQQVAGFSLQEGKLVSEYDRGRIQGILSEIVTVIATGKKTDGQPFTVRHIDSKDEREEFISSIAEKHPKKKKTNQPWRISGAPAPVKKKPQTQRSKGTASTEEQPNLIPRKFKLELPAGKINDIFVEIKELDVTKRRHAVSVLFRVFFELTLDDYITKHGVTLSKDNKGNVKTFLLHKLNVVMEHAKASSLLSEKELKPISMAVGDRHSFLSPETLNAYVHSQWMNPEPLQLKITWANVQFFVERLWKSKATAGQP